MYKGAKDALEAKTKERKDLLQKFKEF